MLCKIRPEKLAKLMNMYDYKKVYWKALYSKRFEFCFGEKVFKRINNMKMR